MNHDEYKQYLQRSHRISNGLDEPDKWEIVDGTIMISCVDPAMMDYVESCTGIAFKNSIGEFMTDKFGLQIQYFVDVTCYFKEKRVWFIIKVNDEFIKKISEKNKMKVGTMDRNRELTVKTEDIQGVIDAWEYYKDKDISDLK